MWKTIKYILVFFALQIVCALMLPIFFFDFDKSSITFLALGLSSVLFFLFIYLVRKDVGLSRDSFRMASGSSFQARVRVSKMLIRPMPDIQSSPFPASHK